MAIDVQHIIDSHKHLRLNTHKCEIIANNFELVDQFPILKDFKRIAKEDMTLLSAPILEGKAVDKALQAKIMATILSAILKFVIGLVSNFYN